MAKAIAVVVMSQVLGCAALRGRGAPPLYKDAKAPTAQRVNDLLMRMTVEEKIQQLRGLWQLEDALVTDGEFDPEKASRYLTHGIGGYGPLRMEADDEVSLRNGMQRYLIEQTRLGIPAIFHDEACHGFVTLGATSFPVPIGVACSWDPDLIERVYRVVGKEMRARGVSQALTPIVDICRDPRWGRTDETMGEDPYLVGMLGAATVRGLQGSADGSIAPDGVAATLKHFAGHGAPQAGINRATNSIPLREMYDAHLVPFRIALAQGHPAAVMPAYTEVDGVPAHASTWLLKDVLRKQFKFQGLVVSDYEGIEYLARVHHVAATMPDAAALALKAGVDVNLPKGVAYSNLKGLVEGKRISMRQLDAAVGRVLRLKFELGLFEHPYGDADKAVTLAELESSRALALEAARKSIVLLKNRDNILPLTKDRPATIAVIGPNAADTRLGSYSGEPLRKISILDAIRAKVGAEVKVVYSQGCKITTNLPESSMEAWNNGIMASLPTKEENQASIAAAVDLARDADVIVLVLGENELMTRESWGSDHIGDRASIELPGAQNELANEMFHLGKPVIVYLMNGRPLATPRIAEQADAIIEGWYMGQETGTAAADVLFGDVNPSGKLTITIPRSTGQIPLYYNTKPGARLYDYVDESSKPLFPFGFGLSYTTFHYSEPAVSSPEMRVDGRVIFSTTVTNTGTRSGDEIVQFYIHQKVGSVTRPIMELRGFERLTLTPGQSKVVQFAVDRGMLAFHDIHMNETVEPGDFELMVGPASDQLQKTTLRLTR